MAKRSLPNLAPTALCHLVEGMTPTQVEAVVGRYHRPNRYEGRRYYAWIGDGGMLRAFFDGPDDTLSKVVLDAAEEERVLDLRGSVRQRIKNCTIIRTWYCVKCRKRYRCSALPQLICSTCQKACEHVPFGIDVPPPRQIKVWDEFWTRYKAEMALLDAYSRGELWESVNLEILGIRLKPRGRAKRRRR